LFKEPPGLPGEIPLYTEIEYGEMIEGYSEMGEDFGGRISSRSAIDECFTHEEVEELRAYCGKFSYVESFEAVRVKFPIRGSVVGYRFFSDIKEDDFFFLIWQKDYPLKFNVWGCYNVEGIEPRGFREPIHPLDSRTVLPARDPNPVFGETPHNKALDK
jgi:hypothetical protein